MEVAILNDTQDDSKKKECWMRLICIEGNIGVGKSWLTNELGSQLEAKVMFEPVDENPYLVKYYADPKRYALEMQFWLMSRRFELHEAAIKHIWTTGQSVIMDRSIYGDAVFAKKNWLDGNIDDLGYESYLKHRDVMNRYLMAPHVTLHLDASPLTCYDRIRLRSRDCESAIPIAYLQGLHDLHRELMIEMSRRGSKVVTLDWNGPVNDLPVNEARRACL